MLDKARARFAWGCAIAVALAPAPVLSASAAIGANTSTDASRSQAELAQLKRWLDDLQQQLATERRRKQSLTHELGQLERQISLLNAQRHQAMARLQQVERSTAELEQRARQLETSRQQSAQALRKLARASYMLGRQSRLKLLLNQQDPAAVARALAVFRYLSKARNQRIEQAKKLQREVAKTRTDLAQRQHQLQELLQQLEHNQTQLDATRAQRKRHLNVISQRLQHNQQQVVIYREREHELQRLLRQLRRQRPPQGQTASSVAPEQTQAQTTETQTTARAAIQSGDFQRHKGKLDAPIEGRVIARFGQPKAESGLRWEGLMFAAEAGRQVAAISAGQVVFADWFGGYGQLIVLDHGDGYMSLYAHNRLLRAQIGALVKTGEWIGEAGFTGGLSRPGLYFEIRHHGEPRDPLQWCRI